jgi:hypothetical protein
MANRMMGKIMLKIKGIQQGYYDGEEGKPEDNIEQSADGNEFAESQGMGICLIGRKPTAKIEGYAQIQKDCWQLTPD